MNSDYSMTNGQVMSIQTELEERGKQRNGTGGNRGDWIQGVGKGVPKYINFSVGCQSIWTGKFCESGQSLAGAACRFQETFNRFAASDLLFLWTGPKTHYMIKVIAPLLLLVFISC